MSKLNGRDMIVSIKDLTGEVPTARLQKVGSTTLDRHYLSFEDGTDCVFHTADDMLMFLGGKEVELHRDEVTIQLLEVDEGTTINIKE